MKAALRNYTDLEDGVGLDPISVFRPSVNEASSAVVRGAVDEFRWTSNQMPKFDQPPKAASPSKSRPPLGHTSGDAPVQAPISSHLGHNLLQHTGKDEKGTSIPSDRISMMRAIRQYEEAYDAAYQVSRQEMRELQTEKRKEGYERMLMTAEDYIGTPEGARRIKFYENRLMMEHEDARSRQAMKFLLEQQAAKARELKRKELALRLAMEKEREEEEKKRRLKEVEERRQKAYEERLRQEQERKEAEERARREQLVKEAFERELARLDALRNEEEAIREAERMRNEAERKKQEEEALRRKLELEAELEKWAQWEKEQQEKDSEESNQRQRDLAAQQLERKRKIEDLKKAHYHSKATVKEVQLEKEKLNKQVRVEQRAAAIAEQAKSMLRGSSVSSLVFKESSNDLFFLTSDISNEEDTHKFDEMDLEQIREEQQRYMKEKRALNIARRTWFDSFKEKEGREPTEKEIKQDMEDIDGQVKELDAFMALLHKRSLQVAKSAWDGMENLKNEEDHENTKKLREKEDQFNKNAKSLVESLIIHGIPVASFKSMKDVERERNKFTKAKRKLKVQVKEWSDLFMSLVGHAPTGPDKDLLAPTLEALFKIENRSRELEVRKNEIEGKAGAEVFLDKAEGGDRPSNGLIISEPTANPKELLDLFEREQINESTSLSSPLAVQIGAKSSLFQRRTSLPQRGIEARLTRSPSSADLNGSSVSGQTLSKNAMVKRSAQQDAETHEVGALEPALAVQDGVDNTRPFIFLKSESIRDDESTLLSQVSLRRSSETKPIVHDFAMDEKNSINPPFKEEENEKMTSVQYVFMRNLQTTGLASPGDGNPLGGAGSLLDAREDENPVKHQPGLQLLEERPSTLKVRDSHVAGFVSVRGTSALCPSYLQGEKVQGRSESQEDPAAPQGLVADVSDDLLHKFEGAAGEMPSKIVLPEDSVILPYNSESPEAPSEAPNAASKPGVFPDQGVRRDSGNRRSTATRASVISSGTSIMEKKARDPEERNQMHPNTDAMTEKLDPGSPEYQLGLSSLEEFGLGKERQNSHSAAQQVNASVSKSSAGANAESFDQVGLAKNNPDSAFACSTAPDANPTEEAKGPIPTPFVAEHVSSNTTSKEAFVNPDRSLPGSAFVEEYFNRILVEVDLETPPKEEETADSFDPEIDIPGWGECMYSELATSAHAAAYFGHYQVLEYLCKYFDVFIMDNNGRTPLFYACVKDQLACAALLVSIGSDWVDVGDRRGDTALHATCCNDSIEVMEFLLQSEANPNVANVEGLTPAHLARSSRALELLYSYNAELHCIDNNNHMPLFTACLEGASEAVQFLCKNMDRRWIGFPDTLGDTALHAAASSGCPESTAHICENAWDWAVLNAMNRKGYTPAHVAANANVLQTLYEYGANIFIANNAHRTPLFGAAAKGLICNVQFLLALCDAQHPDAADTPDLNGDTPLHAASIGGHEECVLLLLRYVKFPGARNCQNLTPADLAMESGFPQLSKIIHDHIRAMPRRSSIPQVTLSFAVLDQVRKIYGSRWARQVDQSTGREYYYDRATGCSQWECPVDFDEVRQGSNQATYHSMSLEQARLALIEFYKKVNPQKLQIIDGLLEERGSNLPELFTDLEIKYGVTFSDIQNKRETARQSLTKLFQQKNPRRLADIENILDERSPNYDKLLRDLERKYNIKLDGSLSYGTG